MIHMVYVYVYGALHDTCGFTCTYIMYGAHDAPGIYILYGIRTWWYTLLLQIVNLVYMVHITAYHMIIGKVNDFKMPKYCSIIS